MLRRFLSLVGTIALCACADPAEPSIPRRSPAMAVVPDSPAAGFLAAYMTSTDERGLYYALSTDGRHFEPLNDGLAVLRATLDDQLLRDPMVFRDRTGRYHLVNTVSWTHRVVEIWDSADLVHWTHERLIRTGPSNSTKAWAPELVYDAQRDRYVLLLTADAGSWPSTAIYAMTTSDFVTFSAPTALYRDTVAAAPIDPTIVADGGTYHLFFRGDGILHATATDVMGPYSKPERILPDLLEGPFVFRDKEGSGWTLLLDNWRDSSGYTVLESDNLRTWTRLTNAAPPRYNATVSFPPDVRHGSVIALTRDEVDSLRSAFETRAVRRSPGCARSFRDCVTAGLDSSTGTRTAKKKKPQGL